MRCARAIACDSVIGLSCGSQMTTTEAAWMFNPTPPATIWLTSVARGNSGHIGLRQLIGLSSNRSSYDAMVILKWSKNPVSPRSPKEGIHGSQNQTGAVQP